MRKQVVLFNLETNTYLAKAKPFTTVKDWREAEIYPSEEFALAGLENGSKVCKDNKLFNWCARTFYTV